MLRYQPQHRIGGALWGTPRQFIPDRRTRSAAALSRAKEKGARIPFMATLSNAHDGVPHGALRLMMPTLARLGTLRPVAPLDLGSIPYAAAWRRAADHLDVAA